jgi:hypothetical protein
VFLRLDHSGGGRRPNSEPPHLPSDQSLDIALERMGAAAVQVLPVVSRFNAREVLGVVYLTDIPNAYRVAMQLSPGAPAAADPQRGTVSPSFSA